MDARPFLSIADARRMGDAAGCEALASHRAVAIAIVDEGGNPFWLERLDGAAPVSSHLGPAKARTAALGRRELKPHGDSIQNASFLSTPGSRGCFEDGVPVLVDGCCVGAV